MKPWLYIPPKISHDLSPYVLKSLALFKPWPKELKSKKTLMSLDFFSPFGTAGGLDKTAESMHSWAKLGAGFIEIGTFTPKPQKANPGTVLLRSLKDQALWNAMGFPNAGFKNVIKKVEAYKKASNLKKLPPLFINVGKNRDTDLKKAHLDYVKGIHFFSKTADAFVINISSPNTKDLRLLHEKDRFIPFIEPILEASNSINKPAILKLSPDLEKSEFDTFIRLCTKLPIAGITLTNTTNQRSKNLYKTFPNHGGLSGTPLTSLACEKLQDARAILNEEGSKQSLISVGGVMTPAQANKRLKMGADLVQMYSGLIFYGPNLLKDSANFKSH